MPQCSKDFLKELTINFAIVIIQFSFLSICKSSGSEMYLSTDFLFQFLTFFLTKMGGSRALFCLFLLNSLGDFN